MSGVSPNEIRSKPQAYLHPLASYYSRVLLPSRLFRGASSIWYWLLIFLLLNIASLASAHTVGISRGEYRLHSMDVTADLTFARPELLAALPQLDTNWDGMIAEQEVAEAWPLLDHTIVQGIAVRTSSDPCVGTLQSAALSEADGLAIRAVYHCPVQPITLAFTVQFLAVLTHGHRHFVTATTRSTVLQSVTYVGNAGFNLATGTDPQVKQHRSGALVWSFFCFGMEHILAGYDHLVFLLGLILVGSQLRLLLRVVTAFTVAHSLTLSLAILGVWAPNPALVEPAIALSIVYVGVENWFVKDVQRRWLITFPFGLIHGFGFAGALQEISLPREQISLALVSFNVGVEVGQIAVLVGVLPVILWLRQQPWFVDHGVKGTNTGIILAGTWWFLARVA